MSFAKYKYYLKIHFLKTKHLLDPMNIPEAKCFLQGAISRGLTWSRYDPDILSDGTYASNPYGYQTLKADIQTKCKGEKLKRQLLRTLRKMYDEQEKKK